MYLYNHRYFIEKKEREEREFFSIEYMDLSSMCRDGGRLEPVQHRLVTLATDAGGGFRGRDAGGWALPKPPYRTSSRVHVPEEQKQHAVRATVHDKALVVLAGCKT